MTINQGKYQIFFFNTPPTIQAHLVETLGFQCNILPSKYLGFPLVESSLKKDVWEDILSSFTNNLDNWAFRSLNLDGRLILVKFVLQTMPL